MAQYEDKYKGLKKEIADEIQTYEIQYFREDKPIPFCGLNIYPASVHDYEVFSNCSSCFTLNKNEDPKGIRMTQLDYLISKTQIPGKEGTDWSFKIQKLFEIIFHIQNGIKCTKCGKVLAYDSPEFIQYIEQIRAARESERETLPQLECPDCQNSEWIEMIKIIQDPETKKHFLRVDGHDIKKDDYDRLRQIVLFQNFPDYRDDSWVDSDIKKDYEERLRLEQKNNDVHASIEKKVICLSISTHYSFEEIYDMSIRRFTMALGAVDDLINYKIMKTATSSGFVSLPKGKTVEHWIYKPYKDMYGDAYKSTEQAQSELNNL